MKLGPFVALFLFFVLSYWLLVGVVYSFSRIAWGAEDSQAILEFATGRYILWIILAISALMAGIFVTNKEAK